MLVQTHFPRQLSRVRYDQYLASGWFRGAVMLYKMDLLCLDNDLYSVVNIRLNLEKFSFSKGQRKLLRKAERKFKICYGTANTTPEKEALYTSHKHRFKGFIHGTLEEYLNAGFQSTVFDTREVSIYDGEKLIAVSYFDLGDISMASLIGLYDEQYSEWSLGKLTMLKEIEFGLASERKWFYPGYILDKDSSFDYKLQLGKMEYYTPAKRWAKIQKFNPSETIGHYVRSATQKLICALEKENIPHKPWLYPYFSMGYMGPWNSYFMRSPAPIELGHDLGGMMVTAYSTEEKAYSLFRIHPCPDGPQFLNLEASKEFSNSDEYLNHLFQIGDIIIEHGTIEVLLDQIRTWRKKPNYLPPV
jgi:arginyl-tRNA--protein-N-Asp/Glu arginylyltransferase